jgi:FkbM family methyltransferase
VRTAWNDRLEVDPREFIGAHVYMRAVHELPVCEVLWRLAAPGERAVDIGANIGVMTSVLSKRVGPSGRVFAFEPHPVLFTRLHQNTRRWNRNNVLTLNWAVSDQNGTAHFCESSGFARNTGTACLSEGVGVGVGRFFEVRTARLDDALPPGDYGVIKIDVEGHEARVLAGAVSALGQGRFRDIVFESAAARFGAAHGFLTSHGYIVFGIGSSLCGPKLFKVDRPRLDPIGAADYLATREPERALERLAPRGWKVLWPGTNNSGTKSSRKDAKLFSGFQVTFSWKLFSGPIAGQVVVSFSTHEPCFCWLRA